MPSLTPEERLLMRCKVRLDISSPSVAQVVTAFVGRVVQHVMSKHQIMPTSSHEKITEAVVEMNKLLRAEFGPFGIDLQIKVVTRGEDTRIMMEFRKP